jgi:hypothetical protein
MRNFAALIVGLTIALGYAVPAKAQGSSFAGRWVNVDPNTRGIVSLNITVSSEKVTVAGKGRCHPNDCDLPAVTATLYRDRSSGVLGHVWSVGDSRAAINMLGTTRMISLADGDYLELEILTSFKEAKPRTPTHEKYILRRETK